jgi:hypothetical protein
MWWWLRDALRQILNQLCPRPGSTEFWSRYLRLMLLIAPLAVTLIFSPHPQQDSTEVLRRIILVILLGHFVSFGLVGRSLFKAVNAFTGPQLPAATAPPAKE